MSTPGIGDPYWYEWSVGLLYVIEMLNPDSKIDCVILQHSGYDVIDDVVVTYVGGHKRLCIQVKHHISTSQMDNLTFGKMLESSQRASGTIKPCLFKALFDGWKTAKASDSGDLKPVLYTNRLTTGRRSGRHYKTQSYSAYSLNDFIAKIKQAIADSKNGSFSLADNNLRFQLAELQEALGNPDQQSMLEFLNALSIESDQPNYKQLREQLLTALKQTFSCNDTVADMLLGRLHHALSTWTTTQRRSERITLEDVYSALSLGEEPDMSQHRLIPPHPFFDSRHVFCAQLANQIRTSQKNVLFLSGEPGSGKTSIISHLQSEYGLFDLRFHTFRPISPEQHFYNPDPGLAAPENLWEVLLAQLRSRFSGRLSQLRIPVSSKLLSLETLRGEVLRLLGIAAQEAAKDGQRIYICIDGIDHAARANIPVSFLSSLPLPEEIPSGVCIVIVGQQPALYRDQYPLWLEDNALVEHIEMPRLCEDDIAQLITARCPQFSSDAISLAAKIHQITQGNNLSVVFSVAIIEPIQSLEEAVHRLDSSGITADIQQYYRYIWDHMKVILAEIMPKSLIRPESIVACSLLLMNGQVHTRILSKALTPTIDETGWASIFDNLHPLVISAKESGSYALFHNDFRVFLMSIMHSYQAQYNKTAHELAMYLLTNDEGLLSCVLGIPLLQCAGEEKLIPNYFTPSFVIHALSEGISKHRLEEFSRLAYHAACQEQDMIGYRNVYLSAKTIYQHERYTQHYNRTYIAHDDPLLVAIDIAEIRSIPLTKTNIREFNTVLSLCKKLLSSHLEEHKTRALRLYKKWFAELSPSSIVPLFKDTVKSDRPWDLVSPDTRLLIEEWAWIAAELGIIPNTPSGELSDLEWYGLSHFGEHFFKHCIELQKHELAIAAINANMISFSAFGEQLESIYYSGLSQAFAEIIARFSTALVDDEEHKENLSLYLAFSMQATAQHSFSLGEISLKTALPSERIYDAVSFEIILKSFLHGITSPDSTDDSLIHKADAFCSELSPQESGLDYVKHLARTACLLGQYYWNNVPPSTKLEGYITWFLTIRCDRPFDYTRARKFLLYTLIHSKMSESLSDIVWFNNALTTFLFAVPLAKFDKADILAYLHRHNKLDIIENYIDTLYGENCQTISAMEDKNSIHQKFIPYGMLVRPKMMNHFSKCLKWDVVNYIDHKEYALDAPLNCFDDIAFHNPACWNTSGKRLYQQSCIASQTGNRLEYDVMTSILCSSAKCGLSDFWLARTWCDEMRLDTTLCNKVLTVLIDSASSSEDMISLWLLCCGLYSWYTQDDHGQMQTMYSACIKQAQKLNLDFNAMIRDITPQWMIILDQLNSQLESSKASESDLAHYKEERIRIKADYDKMTIDELLSVLPFIRPQDDAAYHFGLILDKVSESNQSNREHLLDILNNVCRCMQDHDWLHNGYKPLVQRLLRVLHDTAFWSFANCNESQLTDYDYQTSSNNMQLLFHEHCMDDPEKTAALFDAELSTQENWTTGNGHIDVNVSIAPSPSPFSTPSTIAEMALYILLEQIELNNARKHESAMFALHLLGRSLPSVQDTLGQIWSSLSPVQKQYAMTVAYRWAVDGICSDQLHRALRAEYDSCDMLSQNYYLHSILAKMHNPDIDLSCINCSANPQKPALPKDGFTDQESCYESFLRLIDEYDDSETANALRRYILELSPLDTYTKHRFSESVDILLPEINNLPEKAFYATEHSGRWNIIPLIRKKSHLLQIDDPYILTEMPIITFDEKWFPAVSDYLHTSQEEQLSKNEMHEICHAHVPESECVLSACLWYPWGNKNGKIYTESSFIELSFLRSNAASIGVCLGNYGLLTNEGFIDEIQRSDIGFGGLCLFNRVCGVRCFHFGNCQLAPSSAWHELLNCRPKTNDPYTWMDDTESTVLRFEKIMSPKRSLIQEPYIRQPILFRWLCNKKWLSEYLKKNGLRLYSVSETEIYPQK